MKNFAINGFNIARKSKSKIIADANAQIIITLAKVQISVNPINTLYNPCKSVCINFIKGS